MTEVYLAGCNRNIGYYSPTVACTGGRWGGGLQMGVDDDLRMVTPEEHGERVDAVKQGYLSKFLGVKSACIFDTTFPCINRERLFISLFCNSFFHGREGYLEHCVSNRK